MNKKKPKAPPVEKEREKAWEPKKKRLVLKTSTKLDPDFLKKQVLDDVWIREYYPPRTHSLQEALRMHTELAQPEMTDNMNGLVYLDMTLDLTTKKKTKFIKSVGSIVALPHYFQFGKPRRIMVVAKSEEKIQQAKELGALFYGGDDLIKLIENGAIQKDEFDYVIATLEMMKPMNKLRHFFKDRLPSKPAGNLTEDIETAYRLFDKGMAYSMALTTDESVGSLRFPLGPLSLTEPALLENAAHFIQHISSFRPLDLGPLVTSADCSCSPSPEHFTVDLSEYIPKPKSRSPKSHPIDDEENRLAESG